ncbi:MAG TPA: hypothetical protein VF813_00925, partial [Anaerolineaceae bacterium]
MAFQTAIFKDEANVCLHDFSLSVSICVYLWLIPAQQLVQGCVHRRQAGEPARRRGERRAVD